MASLMIADEKESTTASPKFSATFLRKEDYLAHSPVASEDSQVAAYCGNTRGTFLHPLSFPESPQTDLSHFIDQTRDVPIVCLIPSCNEIFDDTAPMEMDRVVHVDDSFNNERVEVDKITNERVMVDKGTNESAKVTNMDGKTLSLESDISETSNGIGTEEDGVRVHNTPKGELVGVKISKLQFTAKDRWLRHLFLTHKLVLDKVNSICSTRSYSSYWRRRFSEAPLTDFAVVIRTNSTKDERYGASVEYFLLSDALPEDKELRNKLQLKKLEAILSVQQKEREDIHFSHKCVFCQQVFTGNRCVVFQHMLDVHSFNVGRPDNLVFVSEFLGILQQKLDDLQCLYCERFFRDFHTLKDHMRKKQHKKINPQNHFYDKFYLINYLESGKTWEQVQAEDDREILPQPQDSEWNEWQESSDGCLVFCLFCPTSSKDFSSALEHMLADHGFDYRLCCQRSRLDYYGQVKLINYIRRQVYLCICCFCNEKCQSQEKLSQHMSSLGHYSVPLGNKLPWEQPQYFFPTYENDAFLFALEDTFD